MPPDSADEFEPHVGSAFSVDTDLGSVVVTLRRVMRHPRQPGAPREEPFGLELVADDGPALEQGLYDLDHAVLGRVTLFVVPGPPDSEGRRVYDVTFN